MIYISTDKSKLDKYLIHDFLSNRSYWAQGRSMGTVERSLQNSLCFGAYSDEKQVGFARVVSDFAVFAWVMDLFVVEDFRSKGIGKLIMQEIMNHPELQGLQRWGLGTRDAHTLYKQFGFTSLARPEIMMEKVNKPQ
ncbi:GNAT family N-acetyltransferase [soil metagenome]